ncbi:MAG: hypothetical protein ACE5D3_04445 [Candidatus Binatia bacterium]
MDFEGVGNATAVEQEAKNRVFTNGGRPVGPPDLEATEKASRRRFSASYKLSVLEEDVIYTVSGEIIRHRGAPL